MEKKFKGISRIDQNGTHGWYVRIYRNRKTYSKLYSDTKYGGKERALKIAIKARDHAWKVIPVLPNKHGSQRRLSQSAKRNQTGVIGVNRTRKKTSKGVSEYFQVTWAPEIGVVKNKQWSIKKYGEKEAFLRAFNFRKKVMSEIHGEKYDPDQDIKNVDAFKKMLELPR